MSKYLRERQKELIKEVPSLKGVIRETLREVYAPCGKRNCRCKRGFLHGPYYYLAVRTEGKTRRYYLPHPSLGKKAKKAIAQYNKLWNLPCKISDINIKLLKEENFTLKAAAKEERKKIYKPAKKEKESGKPGAPFGHSGITREKPKEPDRRVSVHLKHCPHCKGRVKRIYGRDSTPISLVCLLLPAPLSEWIKRLQKKVFLFIQS